MPRNSFFFSRFYILSTNVNNLVINLCSWPTIFNFLKWYASYIQSTSLFNLTAKYMSTFYHVSFAVLEHPDRSSRFASSDL